ncbi:MAG TPA: PAS domain S-box protein, partial [Rhodospirillaceae bacterium]|nr:PAS domain S-box protein [Rhodospirillaceae bacterium]
MPHNTAKLRRRNLAGFSLGVYRVGDVLEGALTKYQRPGGIDIYLFDDSVPAGSQLIYFHPSRLRQGSAEPEPEKQIRGGAYPSASFPVGDRQWTIIYRPIPGFFAGASTWVSWAAFAAGLLFTALMAVLLVLAIGRETRIAALVDKRTKDLKDSETHIRAVVDNAVDAIITIGKSGSIESFNPAAEKIFGYRRDEVVGKNVNILMPPPYHAKHDGYLRNYLETGERKIIGIGREVEGMRKDGYIFPMDLAVSEMHIARRKRFVGICRDITDRKKVDRMKNEFISTVSHELRTPLTSIQGSLALITRTMPE